MHVQKTKPQFTSVPFSGSSPNGIVEYNGIAKFSAAGIVVEFDSKLLGLVGGEVKEVRIQLDEILDIKFRRGVFKFFAQIQIRLRNFAALAALPSDSGRIKMNVKREDYDLATRAVEQTLQHLQNMQNPITSPADDRRPGELPPTHTPVSVLFDESEDETRRLGR